MMVCVIKSIRYKWYVYQEAYRVLEARVISPNQNPKFVQETI